MATADQIKSLLLSHYKNDRDRFTSIALQVAAHEARKGHMSIAKEIKALIDKAKTDGFKVIKINPNLEDLVLVYYPETGLNSLVLSEEVRSKLFRIIREYDQRDKIEKFGLQIRRKILLSGLPGTGKTATASSIAAELKIPLYVVMMDKLMTKYMGETSAKLRQVFDMMVSNRGIYLFDEFDALGASRERDNEIGEMRRILNSFLQLIEQDTSESIIFCATNHIQILDSALFRRFDDIVNYKLPNYEIIEELIKMKLNKYLDNFSLKSIVKIAEGLSHAEITDACNDALKEIILSNKSKVSEDLLATMIKEKKVNYFNQ